MTAGQDIWKLAASKSNHSGPFQPRGTPPVKAEDRSFPIHHLRFLHRYISSTTCQPPLARHTYTTSFPFGPCRNHAPRHRYVSNIPSPAPQEVYFRFIPACDPPRTNQPRTNPRVAPSAPASSHKVPGSTTYSRLQQELMWAWSCYITPRAVSSSSLKHRLSDQQQQHYCCDFGPRTTVPAFFQTAQSSSLLHLAH